MDSTLLSDDSHDSDIKTMKHQLTEFGLVEENLSREEMIDLLKALNNSKSSEREEDLLRQKVEDSPNELPPRKRMRRKYLAVTDRRLPWSVLPQNMTPTQRARTLAVYIKLISINRYRQARQTMEFEAWPTPIQITEESHRLQPVRSTRSGRMVPTYADIDDDSSDLDFVVTKTKRRKVSNTEIVEGGGGLYANKTFSLKRKPTIDENKRSTKEVKNSQSSKKHQEEHDVEILGESINFVLDSPTDSVVNKDFTMDCEY